MADGMIPEAHVSAVNDYDLVSIRRDFPILSRLIHGKKPLVYLDNGASAQKPQAVIDRLSTFYSDEYSNVHRGLHELSGVATEAYEAARETVRSFLNASDVSEIVFTKGGSEAINIVANAFAAGELTAGDEILVSEFEHHSNIVPWMMLRQRLGVSVKPIPFLEDGSLDMEVYASLLSERTKMVAVAHASNTLGTIPPVKRMIEMAHAVGAAVLLDGCQAAVHMPVDVQDLDVDFYVITGHKLYGPTGIGVLYAKRPWLDRLPPWQGGGDMIKTVSFDEITYAEPPAKFEAGTPPIAQAVGLGAALDYITGIGLDRIARHEADLLAYATPKLRDIPGVTVHGDTEGKAAIISFTMDYAHAHDIGTILDQAGVAVRAGHHCAQPVMEKLDVAATARASFGLYNSRAEVDVFVAAVEKVHRLLG